MKKKQRKAGLARMRAYVATLQPVLRLQQWDIAVVDAPPDGADWLASCETQSRSWQAKIAFADAHFASTPEEQRITVAHELIHLVNRQELIAAREAFEGLSATGQEWARERHDNEHERTTDHLSRIIAPFLPLPPAE